MKRENLFRFISVALSIFLFFLSASQGYSEKTSFPRNTGLVLTPTAFTGHRSRTGINVDILFTYFIGEMFGEEQHKFDYFDPLRTWTLSGDIKWGIKCENDMRLAVAVGALGSTLMTTLGEGDNPNSRLEFAGEWLGSLYLVGSKSFRRNSRIHLGYMWGTSPRLLNFLSNDIFVKSSNTIFAGLDTEIFGRRQISIEAIFPAKNSYLIDLHIDRLFGFDFAYLKFPEGYSVIGFYNYRIGLFPVEVR